MTMATHPQSHHGLTRFPAEKRGFAAFALCLTFVLFLMAGYTSLVTAQSDTRVTPAERQKVLERVMSHGYEMPRSNIDNGKTGTDGYEAPAALRSNAAQTALRNRADVPIYTHNPLTGKANAPVTIIEMTDLSCQSCMGTLKEIDALRRKYPDKIRLVNKHLPQSAYSATNTAAFYGKVAQKADAFWNYRKGLYTVEKHTPDVYQATLLEAGVPLSAIKTAIRGDARQFYRELDADALLGQKLGLGTPVEVYVNGIRLGGGIPFSALEDLVEYEIHRLTGEVDG